MNNLIYESCHDKTGELFFASTENATIDLHLHKSYELIYVIEGSIKAKVANKSVVANKDDILFIDKYYPHEYTVNGFYKKYVLVIPPTLCNDFENVFKDKRLSSILKDKKFNKTLLPIIQNMDGRFDTLSPIVKKGYVNIIIGELLNHYRLLPINKDNSIDVIVSILEYIEDNYYKDLSLENIADEFGYSKYYFSKIFNSYMKENLNNYINLVRLQHFINKLNQANKNNISNIAYECGFNSMPTFYRCFKKLYGVNPKEKISSINNTTL